MSFEDGPRPIESGWLVWTDMRAYARGWTGARHPEACATWFWSAAGPRGYESGAEGTAEQATNRAQAAAALLRGTHEK